MIAGVLKRDLIFLNAALPLRLLVETDKKLPERLPFPFCQRNIVFAFGGTAAIYHGIRALNLSAKDTVLCPSYNCGYEIEPILRNRVSIKFYSVNKWMLADLEDLERKIDRQTRAVLITHYFGFPQPIDEIKEICNRYGLYLVEDCAHALLSKCGAGYLGTIGDVVVFSMRKSLPIPNGGALLINNPSINLDWNPVSPDPLSTWTKIIELVTKEMARGKSESSLLYAPISRLLLGPLLLGSRIVSQFGTGRFELESRSLELGMAQVGIRIMKKIDFELVFKKRRENFECLLSGLGGLDGVRAVFDYLPKSVCPLFFPLLVENRHEIIHTLYKEGISSSTWWRKFHPSVCWSEFPDAAYLKDNIMILPVHQDLDASHIQRMVHVLHKICAK